MPKTASVKTPAMTLEVLDPAAITVVGNIRDAQPSKELIDSIRANWVRQPIGVLRTPDGELVLRFGARRRLACIEVGCQVPAVVVEGTAGTTEAEIARILEQWDENENREGLTTADRAAAVAQLFDLGANAVTVKKMTGYERTEIAAARKTHASDTARTLAHQYPLDMLQAAAIAEFDDEPAIAKHLAVTAVDQPGQFDHQVQQCRDKRTERAMKAARAAELDGQGIKVSDDAIHYENGLNYWVDTDGNRLDPASHKDCPGNVVVLYVMGHGDNRYVDESWYCTDPKANGHKKRHDSGQPETSPEDKRRVREGNSAWRSATTVRQRWLTDVLLHGKDLPAGAALFTVKALAAADSYLIRSFTSMSGGRHKTARALLGGIEADSGYSGYGDYKSPLADSLTGASEQRAHLVTFALVIGACEWLTADTMTWRTPQRASAEYLTALAGWGYDLAPCEQAVVDAVRAKAEAVAEAAAVDAAEVAARTAAEAAAGTGEDGEGFADTP
jgi:ParB family chromosome partitioning protein